MVRLCGVLFGIAWLAVPSWADPAPVAGAESPAPRIEIFKTPSCGCCSKWADHLESHGFRIEVKELASLDGVKQRGGVPRHARSCHTAFVEGYVVEGHVPAADVERLLSERPAVAGLVVPGMPVGSPGMEGPGAEPYTVFSFDRAGQLQVFSRHE